MADPVRSVGTVLILGIAGVVGIAMVIGLARSCREPAVVTSPAPSSPAPPAATETRLSESAEVKGVIGLLWPTARKVSNADWRWAGCSDKEPGFADARRCLADALRDAEELQSHMPAALKVKTACGKDVEKAHRAYVDGRVRFLRDELAWFDKNQAKLKPLMATKPLSDAWNEQVGPGRPIGIDEKYTQGLLVITGNDCVKRMLECPSIGCPSDRLSQIAGIAP